MAEASTSHSSSLSDNALTYAAALLFQALVSGPFQARNAGLAWACAVVSLGSNGFDVDEAFDHVGMLRTLDQERRQPGGLVLARVVEMLSQAIC